jgi:uncharacterized protein (DUF362 family)
MKNKQNPISRRRWLTLIGTGSLGGLFTGFINIRNPEKQIGIQENTSNNVRPVKRRTGPVSLIKGDDRYTIVFKALKNIEDDVIKAISDKPIIIKPNLVVENRPACATDPQAMKAILDFLKPHFSKQITIAESTAAFKNVTTLDLFRQYGYSFLENEYNIKFVDLNTSEFEYRPILGVNNTPNFIRVTKPLLDPSNFIISAAKMKTHSQCIVTLSLKNVLMAAPINDYKKNDWRFGDKFDMHVVPEGAVNAPIFYNLFRMAHYVYPDLAVIDGFEGMEGNGPAGGTPIASRMAIASLDPLAADTIGATVMGFDPEIIPYLRYINQGGFGQGNANKITVIGSSVAECKMKFKPSDESARVFKLT